MPRNVKSLTVSCFGKLPQFGDFIRVNASNQSMQIFDRWLQEGLYFAKKSLGGQFDTTFDNVTPQQFLFAIPDLKSMIFGVLIPGKDKVGRRYPFYYAVTIPYSYLKRESLSHQILHLIPFVNACVENHSRLVELEQATALTSHLEEMSQWISPENNQLIRDYQNWKQEVTAADLLTGDEAQNQQFALMFNELRKPVPVTNKLGWFLRSSLQDTEKRSFTVPVLMDIYRNTNSNVPSFFWDHPETGAGNILLFPNQPAPKILLDLLQDSPSAAHFHSTAAADVMAGGAGPELPGRDSLQNLSLDQFIHSFAR